MKSQLAWLFVAVLWFSGSVFGQQSAITPAAYNGVVTTISEGTLYIHGIPHCIATVDTNQGAKRVAVPTMGVMQPLQIGESLSFAGPTITVNSILVINTQEGFIFRATEKGMAAYMADVMNSAQAKAMEAEKSGIPNAVPTLIVESREQVEQSTTKRRTDILLTLLSLLVALLAYERIQHFAVAPARWIRTRLAKRTTPPGGQSAQQTAPTEKQSGQNKNA